MLPRHDEHVNKTFEKLIIGLYVEKIGDSIDFYRDILGFKVVAKFPTRKGQCIWAVVSKNDVEIHLTKKKKKKSAPYSGSGTYAVIKVSNIEEFYGPLIDGKFIKKPLKSSILDVKEFSIVDPNGFHIVFIGKKDEIRYCAYCGSKNNNNFGICEICGFSILD